MMETMLKNNDDHATPPSTSKPSCVATPPGNMIEELEQLMRACEDDNSSRAQKELRNVEDLDSVIQGSEEEFKLSDT